jgi:hypothetical protein
LSYKTANRTIRPTCNPVTGKMSDPGIGEAPIVAAEVCESLNLIQY